MTAAVKHPEERRPPYYVVFVGGSLDGRSRTLEEVPATFRASDQRIFVPGASRARQRRERYILTERGGKYFYVEEELFNLGNAENIDPRSE